MMNNEDIHKVVNILLKGEESQEMKDLERSAQANIFGPLECIIRTTLTKEDIPPDKTEKMVKDIIFKYKNKIECD